MLNVRENKVGAAHPTLVLVGLWVFNSSHWKTEPPSDTTRGTLRPVLIPANTSPASRQELGAAGSRKAFGEFCSGIYSPSSMPIQLLLLPEGSSHSFPPHRTGNAECDPHVPVGRARATAPPVVAFPRISWCVGRTGTGILGGGSSTALPAPGRRDFCRNKLNPPD